MRFERWYWLIIFCVMSLFIHAALGWGTKGYALGAAMPLAPRAEVEVTLTPGVEDKPALTPPQKPEPKQEIADTPTPPEPQQEIAPVKIHAARATQIARSADTEHIRLAAPQRYDSLAPVKTAARPDPIGNTAEEEAAKLDKETPLPLGKQDAPISTTAPRLNARTKALDLPKEEGGGSLAPDKTLTGKNGASGPETPPDDLINTGGGAGGLNLPKAPAKVGGGGGNSILSVDNPLAKEAVPEDKPGLGPGLGGGAGTGSGGGAGFRAGRGIGTHRTGLDLATLNAKPGNGIGGAEGGGIGTRAPGGGKGTGAEMPGTGGEGAGYGIGKGNDIGNGASRLPTGGLTRGIPFGDIKGLLSKGDPKGGGGGEPGRGGVLGVAPTIRGGGNAPIHIIYVLDTSGSMRDFDKIFKAKDALCRALLELRSNDTFNIIDFNERIHVYSAVMLPATKSNIQNAYVYTQNMRVGPGTDVSDAMEIALSEETVTHIFLMSDGEPNRGISDFMRLRAFIKERNKRSIQINTLALGVGDNFPGIRLLRGIAGDNEGLFRYINMVNDTAHE